MKKIAWMLAGLLLGGVAFWPAATLQGNAQRALPPGSSVALSGSVWNGQGQIQTGGSTWPFEWRFKPSRVFAAELAWDIDARPTGARASAQAVLGFGGWTVRAPAFEGEIHALHTWLPALKLMGVQGRAQWSAPELAIKPSTPWRVDGEGSLALSELSIAAIGGSALGTHELRVDGSGDAVTFEIVKSDGVLKVEGKGRISNGGEYSVQGSALPLASFDADARARLARYATVQTDGRFRFDARGKW
ncbi:MAG: type II secretion system protein N [Betaproteobacteria bacterium]|nr:type II secretion system protein N [Betaproteobacteria bacterium]